MIKSSYQLHEGPIESFLYLETERLLISGSSDSNICVFDLFSNRVKYKFTDHTSTIVSIRRILSTDEIISISVDTTMKIWDFAEGKLICSVRDPDYRKFVSLEVIDESTFATSSEDVFLNVWKREGNKVSVEKKIFHNDLVEDVCCHHKSRNVIVLAGSVIYNYLFGREIKCLTTIKTIHKEYLERAIIYEYPIVIVCCADSSLSIHDVEKGESLKFINHPPNSFNSIHSLGVDMTRKSFMYSSTNSVVSFYRLSLDEHKETVNEDRHLIFTINKNFRSKDLAVVKKKWGKDFSPGNIFIGDALGKILLVNPENEDERSINDRFESLYRNLGEEERYLSHDLEIILESKKLRCFASCLYHHSSLIKEKIEKGEESIENKMMIYLDVDLDVDEELFFSILLGMEREIPEESVSDYFILFEELRMYKFSWILLQRLKLVTDGNILFRLANRFISIIKGAGSGSDSELSDYCNVMDNRIQNSLFVHTISGIIKKEISNEKTSQYRKLLKLEENIELSGYVDKAELQDERINLREKYEFESHPMSFSHLFEENLSKLYKDLEKGVCKSQVIKINARSKKKEILNAHLEILMYKSNFFSKMFSFRGREFHQLSKTGGVEIELLGSDELKEYIRFLYRKEFHLDGLDKILRLANFSEMFINQSLKEYCMIKVTDILGRLKKDEFMKCVARHGYLFEEYVENFSQYLKFDKTFSKEEFTELIKKSKREHLPTILEEKFNRMDLRLSEYQAIVEGQSETIKELKTIIMEQNERITKLEMNKKN